jgi:hypothetical protein
LNSLVDVFTQNKTMKQFNLMSLIVLVLTLSLSSCEVIGGIFKTSVWLGILAILGGLGLIVYLVSRSSKR